MAVTHFEAIALRVLFRSAADESDHCASAWQVAKAIGPMESPTSVGGALARMLRSGLVEVGGTSPNGSRRYRPTARGRAALGDAETG